MGLDMYLTGKKFYWTNWQDASANKTEDGFEVRDMSLQLGYWRKHPNLHGFIVNTFAGGKDECQEIPLSFDDLQTIIDAVKSQSLPATEGFFFGKSEDSEEQRLEDVKILEDAKAWLKDGDCDPVERGASIALGGGITMTSRKSTISRFRVR